MTTNATTGTTPTKKLNDVAWKMYELRCSCVTMNELINVIWDYSNKIQQEFNSAADEIVKIRNAMSEVENQ